MIIDNNILEEKIKSWHLYNNIKINNHDNSNDRNKECHTTNQYYDYDHMPMIILYFGDNFYSAFDLFVFSTKWWLTEDENLKLIKKEWVVLYCIHIHRYTAHSCTDGLYTFNEQYEKFKKNLNLNVTLQVN